MSQEVKRRDKFEIKMNDQLLIQKYARFFCKNVRIELNDQRVSL